MTSKGSYIIVGENIHCTRIRLATGKFVAAMKDGRSALTFKEGAETRFMPIPEAFTSGEEWQNGKIKHVQAAICQGMYGSGDDAEAGKAYLRAMAREQEAAGAWFLDVNVDEFSMDLAEKIKAIEWTASILQSTAGLPLSIDSSDPNILRAGLAACDKSRGKPMVNSVSLERAAMIPIAAKAGACVIAGATGESSMPASVEDRLANITQLMATLADADFALGDIYLDPLVMPVSVDTKNPGMVMEAVKAMRSKYGKDVHFAPGLSNVSFGLPKRAVINQVFAWLCRKEGCDGGIVDPMQINDKALSALDTETGVAKLAKELLLGNDEYGMNFITASRDGTA
jgi:5-methyltetrahydrofolate corrinoid/iron sulfur protein methyltransferase